MDTDNSEGPTTDGTSFPTPDEPVARLTQGVAYCWGDEVARDIAKGVELIREAIGKGVERLAEQGNAEAQNALAACYYYGWCVNKDYAEAARWYRLAAEQGHDGAQYKLGKCYDAGCGVSKDIAEAARWFRLAAEQEHAEAQCRLGAWYLDGIGVGKDEKQAGEWLNMAAGKGNTEAKELLKKLNPGKTVDLCRKKAKGGDTGATLELGRCYLAGRGVEGDEAQAARWLCKAADEGNTKAEELLQKLDPGKAAQLYQLAAKGWNIYAMYHLAECYRDGVGVSKNEKRTVYWFRKAALYGDEYPNATFELGKCYLAGIGVEKDEEQAKKWLRKAADKGYAPARELLQKLK